MAKKQLKKLNQPKKYLQGGSNLGSVSQIRQNPYYIGQVGANAAQDQYQSSQQQIAQAQQDALQRNQQEKEIQQQQLDSSISKAGTNVAKALKTDYKDGRFGNLFSKNLQGQAAMNISAGTQVAPMYAAPATTTTIASNVGSLTPGAAEVGANLANTSTNVVSGVNAATAGVPAAVAPTGEAVTQGVANTAGKAAGTASSAVAIPAAVATVGGQIWKHTANDKRAYTSTQKERTGNMGGSIISGAGTGVAAGAQIGGYIAPWFGPAAPVVEAGAAVVGGLIGGTIGGVKAGKENKAAIAESRRLQEQERVRRNAFQGAFVNSRLTSADPGNPYAGNDVQNQFTNQYQVAQTGGVTGIQEDRRPQRVPGGKIVPIEGTDAMEFIGRTHKDGGIIIEKDSNGKPTVEVEHKEVQAPIVMSNNKKQDYIFSEYLKLGGKSFAQRSKEILKGKGSQQDLQQLAAAQEKIAGRNSQQIAQYGGVTRYKKGGPVVSKDCPPGTIYNAYTGNCEPFSFNSVANMVTGKTSGSVNVANNAVNNTPTNTGTSAVPAVISKPGKKYSQAEKDAGWKYVYDVAKSLGDPYPEISASQWALESGWGSSNTGTFNPFGQTASKGESGTKLNTPKDPGGGSKKFKNYSSYEEAIQDHINRWAPKYKDAKDPLEAVYMLQNHGGAPRYAEGHNNDWEGYVKKIIKLSDSRSKTFGVHRESTYVPDKTKYPKAKGINVNTTASTEPVKKTLLPPPPVSGDVVPPTFAQRNALPGIGAMQMNEEIQMPEYPKSNITFDPTGPDNVNEQRPMKYITTETSEVNDRNFKRRKKVKPTLDVTNASAVAAAYDAGEITGEEYVAALQKGTALLKEENDKKRKELGIAQQNGTANAPAVTAYNATTGVKPNTNGNPPAITDAEKKQALDQLAALDADWAAGKFSKDEYNAKRIELFNSPAFNAAIDDTNSGSNPIPYNSSSANTQPVLPTQPPGSATATNGGPGTAPTINNQNSTFQYTAQTPGYLDYNDPNTAGGIFSGDRYEKDWKPLVGSTMADAAKADQVINYLTNYTGADAADVKAKIAGKNRTEQIAIINDLATDTKVGPFHNAVFGAIHNALNNGGGNVATNNPPVIPPVVPPSTTSGTTTTTKRYTPCPPGTYLSTDGTCKQTPEYSKPYDGNIVAAAGAAVQLAPPIYAALKPYQKVGPIEGAPSVRGALLGRENMNTERRNVGDMYTAINQEVTNNNTGASGFAIRQAANVTAGKQMLDVANAEAKINTELRGKEAVLGQDASKFNAENSMKGQMFNADLAQKQNQYIDERNIGVVDAAANRLAGMANTYNQYKATDHLARVTNANTHSLERDKMYESLLKDSQNKNSQFNGATDAELRRIAAGLVEEQMGGVGRTGGVRQYISRLGELKSARATKAKL